MQHIICIVTVIFTITRLKSLLYNEKNPHEECTKRIKTFELQYPQM